jgi:hypothetical protein
MMLGLLLLIQLILVLSLESLAMYLTFLSLFLISLRLLQRSLQMNDVWCWIQVSGFRCWRRRALMGAQYQVQRQHV